MVLLGVYPGALHVCNRDGATSLHLAEQRGHFALVQHITSLQMAAQVINEAEPPAGCSVAATNDRLFSDIANVQSQSRDGVLSFVNSPPPVASSTPVRETLESHDVLTRPTGIATVSHRRHIADNEQLSIEIPTPLTLTKQASHRGSSLPRCLHASPRAGSSRDGTSVQRHFMKRTSVDVLPDYARLHSGGDLASVASPAGMRSVNSDPYLARDPDPMISVSGRDVYSPDVFMQPDYHPSYNDAFSLDLHHHIAMDTGTCDMSEFRQKKHPGKIPPRKTLILKTNSLRRYFQSLEISLERRAFRCIAHLSSDRSAGRLGTSA